MSVEVKGAKKVSINCTVKNFKTNKIVDVNKTNTDNRTAGGKTNTHDVCMWPTFVVFEVTFLFTVFVKDRANTTADGIYTATHTAAGEL